MSHRILLICIGLFCSLVQPDWSAAGPLAASSSDPVPIVLLRRSAKRGPGQVGLPPSLMGEDRPAFEARMYRDVMPPEPGGALENASQMMASEGVIATLFYRLASDERLKNAYREAAFYEAFLQPDQVAELHRLGPQAVVSAAENIYLKMFDVMHRSFTWGSWPAIAFVSAYAKQFPGEASAVYDVFLDVTRGVTVDRAAHTRHGEPGYLAGLRDRLLAGEPGT